MNFGDVFWVEFPAHGGHAQAGRRPAVIMQAAAVSARVPTALLMPLTTQLDALRFPGTVLIEMDTENGLRRPSVALAFQMTVLDQGALGTQIGRLCFKDLQAVRDALDEVTGR